MCLVTHAHAHTHTHTYLHAHRYMISKANAAQKSDAALPGQGGISNVDGVLTRGGNLGRISILASRRMSYKFFSKTHVARVD